MGCQVYQKRKRASQRNNQDGEKKEASVRVMQPCYIAANHFANVADLERLNL